MFRRKCANMYDGGQEGYAFREEGGVAEGSLQHFEGGMRGRGHRFAENVEDEREKEREWHGANNQTADILSATI